MNYKNFEDLGLNEKVLKSIKTLGFEKPSKIQSEIIPLIIEGYDVIGNSQTGTGKTLAFASSILSKIDVEDNLVKAIILVPTRELALQVSEEFESLNKSSNFDILAVFGGSSIDMQMKALKRGVDIVVGTPGRIIDLIKRKVLKLNNLEFFVLDEADEMLNMGFEEDIKEIFNKTKSDKQVLLFSATMPKQILTLAKNYMKKNYKSVEIQEKSNTSINVSQSYYLVNEKMRAEAVCRVIDSKNIKLGIIFCQKKSDVDRLLNEMSSRNYNVEAMHGDIAQSIRLQTLDRFKKGYFNFLIATDVAARGIHVDNIDVVINYNLPQDVESYIHRIGRTGRAGKKGEAISFVTMKEVKFLKDVEKVAKCEIVKKELPNKNEVLIATYDKIMTNINEIIKNKEYENYIPYVRDMNKDELMKFSASILKCWIDKNIGSDFNKEIVIKKDRRDMVSKDNTRVFLTIGSMDGLKMGSLLDYLKETTKIRKENFTNIQILQKYTFIDVNNKYVDELIKKLYNKKFKNRIIRIEKSKKK